MTSLADAGCDYFLRQPNKEGERGSNQDEIHASLSVKMLSRSCLFTSI